MSFVFGMRYGSLRVVVRGARKGQTSTSMEEHASGDVALVMAGLLLP